MRAEALLAEIIYTLRGDPKADVAAMTGELLQKMVDHSLNEFEELLAAVLFVQGTPVCQLERADLAEVATVLGAHPGVKVERFGGNGFVPANRPAGAKPIVMQLTLENSAERARRLRGGKEG